MHSVKKLALLILALSLALGCPALAAERVEDPAGLFSFIPPPESEGWEVNLVRSANKSAVLLDLADRGAHLTVSAGLLPEGTNWPEEEARLKKSLSQKISQPRFGPFKLCDRPALAAIGQSKEDPEKTFEMVATAQSGLGLIVSIVYPSDAWTEFRPIFEKVLSSLSCRLKP